MLPQFLLARAKIHCSESSKKYRVSCSEYRELNLPGSCSVQVTRHLVVSTQTQNRRPDRFFRPAASIFDSLLCLNDSRRDEENQLLVGGVDHRMLEQVAQDWNVTQQWHLRNVDRVLRLNHAADYHRAP